MGWKGRGSGFGAKGGGGGGRRGFDWSWTVQVIPQVVIAKSEPMMLSHLGQRAGGDAVGGISVGNGWGGGGGAGGSSTASVSVKGDMQGNPALQANCDGNTVEE